MADWLDAEAHADRAFEYFERGRWNEAESELRKALALNPQQGEWHFNLALTLEASGRDHEAMSSFECAIELMPEESEPLVAAGMAAARLGRLDDSLKWLSQALAIDSSIDAAYAQKMEVLVRKQDHEQVEETYYVAQQFLEEPSANCLAVMAESLIQRREFERAGWCLREALRHAPNMPRLRARLGCVLAESGQRHRALQMFLRDLRDDPGNIDTLLEYGELLIELGRHVEAGEKFRRVLELEPANVDAHAYLGQIALRNRHFETAHLEFELVLKLEPQHPTIRLHLAEAMLRRNRHEAAAQTLQEQFEMHRQAEEQPLLLPNELSRFGRLLLEAQLPAQAVALHEYDLRENGVTASRLRELALARFRSGDRTGGIAASRRVLRLDPKCIRSMHNLALAAVEEGRLQAAAGWIARGRQLDRHDDGLRQLRGRLGLFFITATARRLWHAVMARWNDCKQAIRARRKRSTIK